MKNINLILIASILALLCFASCETKSITEEDQEFELLQTHLNDTVGEDGRNEDDEDSEGD